MKRRNDKAGYALFRVLYSEVIKQQLLYAPSKRWVRDELMNRWLVEFRVSGWSIDKIYDMLVTATNKRQPRLRNVLADRPTVQERLNRRLTDWFSQEAKYNCNYKFFNHSGDTDIKVERGAPYYFVSKHNGERYGRSSFFKTNLRVTVRVPLGWLSLYRTNKHTYTVGDRTYLKLSDSVYLKQSCGFECSPTEIPKRKLKKEKVA